MRGAALVALAAAALTIVAAARAPSRPAATLPPSRPVLASTTAGWPTFPHSILLETGEWLAAEDPRLFWSYVDALCAAPAPSDAGGATLAGFSVAASLLPQLSYDVLRLSVLSRAYSPLVETHRSVASGAGGGGGDAAGCGWWVVAGSGKLVACDDAAALTAALGGLGHEAAPETYAWDHVYPGLHLPASPTLVLYGQLGDASLAAPHSALAAAAPSGSIRYVLRHAARSSMPGAFPTTGLAGYGVGLDLKSTEYKVTDDRGGAGAPRPSEGDVPRVGDASLPAGWLEPLPSGATPPVEITFAARRAAHPNLVAALDAAEAEASPPLPWLSAAAPLAEGAPTGWELSDLGLQATAYIVGEGEDRGDPLQRLLSVSSNLPSLARFLSRYPVPQGLREELSANSMSLNPGSTYVTVNGIAVEPTSPSFNVFALFNVLRAEANVVSQLDTLPLSPADKRRVQVLAVPSASRGDRAGSQKEEDDDAPDTGPLRVDVFVSPEDVITLPDAPYPHPVITWVNNMEDNAKTMNWPHNLHGLLHNMWGQLHQIARNLYNVILITDCASSNSASMRSLATASYLLSNHMPITLSVVPVPGGTPAEVSAMEGAGGLSPLSALPPINQSAPVDGLGVALLHTSAVMRHGEAAGAEFLVGLGSLWRAHMDREMAASGHHGSQTTPPVIVITFKDAISVYAATVSTSKGKAALAEAEAAVVDAKGELRGVLARVVAWVARPGTHRVRPFSRAPAARATPRQRVVRASPSALPSLRTQLAAPQGLACPRAAPLRPTRGHCRPPGRPKRHSPR